ncbi:hypothetical protein DAMA08_016120 [Martiniozyma asiatica (nom. inval.)]|nr:hypothetical protein DAMA08_016120 [Martiniozyma asiatica]
MSMDSSTKLDLPVPVPVPLKFTIGDNHSTSDSAYTSSSDSDEVSYNDEENDDSEVEKFEVSSSNFYRINDKRISRSMASSIIGGLDVKSPNLSVTSGTINRNSVPPPTASTIPRGQTSHFINRKNEDYPLNSNNQVENQLADEIKDKVRIDINTEDDEQTEIKGILNDNDAKRGNQIRDKNFNANSNDTNLIFNFSLPFSTPNVIDRVKSRSKILDSINKERISKSKIHRQIPSMFKRIGKAISPSSSSSSQDSSIFTKLHSKSSLIHPKCDSSLISKFNFGELLSNNSSQHKALNFWENLALEDVNIEDKYLLREKLSNGINLTTAEAARYYKDIENLDDGKYKALRASIISSTPISRNNSATPINNMEFLPWISKKEAPQLPPHLKIYDDLEGDIVIIGGYRGSILRDSKTNKRAWIPVIKAGLNIRKIDLLLGPNDEDELNATDKFYPDGMLSHIGPVDITKNLMKKLSLNPNVTVHNWGYDWRLSLDLTSQKLFDFINALFKKNGGKKILLITHSMGGLVAHGAMVKNPHLIKGIIYAGTPLPCGNILGPLRFSDSILLSKDLLTNEVNFMMRSSFVFVPRKEMGLFRDIESGKLILENGQPLDFWKSDTWVRWNLNPLVAATRWRLEKEIELLDIEKMLIASMDSYQLNEDKLLYGYIGEYIGLDKSNKKNKRNDKVDSILLRLTCELPDGIKLTDVLPVEGVDPVTEAITKIEIQQAKLKISFNEAVNYLSNTIKRTDNFLNSLKRKENVEYPPMVQIFGSNLPSVKYCLVNGEEGIKQGDYYNFFYAEGDGVAYKGWLFPRDIDEVKSKTLPANLETIPNEISQEELEGFGYDEQWAYKLKAKIRVESGHIGLLTDLNIVGKALLSLGIN